MDVVHLRAHGFTDRIIDNWKRHMPALLPLQQRVIATTGLLRGSNVIVFAPTSSGKTFIGELAAMRQFEQGRKTIFLSPTKALAEEQYARLKRLYTLVGAKVVIATRERTAHDAGITAGNYDIAVMVYEKLKAFIGLAPQILDRIGAVIVDELQILGDPDRGPAADMLLTRLVHAQQRPQIVALSAVLAENARLSSWLNAEMFVWRERPVELREGVLDATTGVFAYREFNSRAEGAEELLKPMEAGGDDEFPLVRALAGELCGRGEQVLVFVPTRDASRRWAFGLTGTLGLEPARIALDSLGECEPSHSRELLERCFDAGVAFHNADLPHAIRGVIEREFRAGSIRVLVATSTLAQGVNLTCRNVISVPAMLKTTHPGRPPVMCPLSVQRFRNQGGRAGRYAAGDDYGRSILIASDAAQAQLLARTYVRGEVEPLEPAACIAALGRLVLDAVQHLRAASTEDIGELLLASYAGATEWLADPPRFNAQMNAALEELRGLQLLRVRRGRFELTGAGEVVSSFGLEIETARLFLQYCAEIAAPPGVVELLALCAFSADGADFPLAANPRELAAREYAATAEGAPGSLPQSVESLLRPDGGLSEEDHAALKKVAVAEGWLGNEATTELEERFRVFAGTMANLGAHLAWLAQGLAALAAALGKEATIIDPIRALADRLPEGITEEGLEVARMQIPGLSRSFVATLVREGFDTPVAIADAGMSAISRILPEDLAERLIGEARNRRQPVEAHQGDLFASYGGRVETPTEAPDPVGEITVDEASPGQVWYAGRLHFLPPLPWKLLALLLLNAGRVVPYEQIERELWPDAVVERQQIGAHRRVILQTLVAPPGMIRTANGHGLCLALAQPAMAIEG
jgi:helicase